MFDGWGTGMHTLLNDRDEAAIRLLLDGLRGDAARLDPHVESNLLRCATMSLYQGRRMGLGSQDAFDALAAICLVLGERRTAFFENAFMQRLIGDPGLSARQKLNRVVEIVITTVPRPSGCGQGDTSVRETA